MDIINAYADMIGIEIAEECYGDPIMMIVNVAPYDITIHADSFDFHSVSLLERQTTTILWSSPFDAWCVRDLAAVLTHGIGYLLGRDSEGSYKTVDKM